MEVIRRLTAISSMRRRLLLPVIFVAFGCRNHTSAPTPTEQETPASNSAQERPPKEIVPDKRASDVPLLSLLPQCNVFHDGLVLDLGESDPSSGTGFVIDTRDPADNDRTINRGGSTFRQVTERRFARDFWLDEPATSLRIRAHVFPRSATAISVSLDGKRLGRIKLAKKGLETLTFPRHSDPPLSAGRHTLLFEAHGRQSSTKEPFYDLDWVNLTPNEDRPVSTTPPTLRDLIADHELDGVPRRSIVLKAHTAIRCPVHLAGPTRLELSLGLWGTGTGTAEIAVVEENQPRAILQERRVTGAAGEKWLPLSVDLAAYAGRVVALEIKATRVTSGGRIAFGEPRLRRPEQPLPPSPKAKNVVVVIASGIDRRLIPPWGPPGEQSAISELLRDSVAFHAYRTPTTVPSGVIASLLSGLSPSQHHVEDTAARLSSSLLPLSRLVKQAGGRTAMFTAVPTTFAAFGFNSGWDDFGAFSPVVDLPAETAITEASRWLAQKLNQRATSPQFIFVHARGAHPPWDITKEQAAQLAPQDYSGALDARRGGITLGRIRRQTAKVQRRLNEEDTQRLGAFMSAALAKQNAALSALIANIKQREAWDQTLFIFAGDVANSESPAIPFDPLGSLREDQLTVPLIVKFPGRAFAGKTFDKPVTTVDLTRTILEALDFKLPDQTDGISLFEAVSGREPILTRTLVATLGQRYVARAGVWLLTGELGSPPKLCQTDVDPICVDEKLSKLPLTAHALWQWTAKELASARRAGTKTQREPASIDTETASALTVWGNVEM